MKIATKVIIILLMIAMVTVGGLIITFEFIVIPSQVESLVQKNRDLAYQLQRTIPLLTDIEKQLYFEDLRKQQRDLSYVLILDHNGKAMVHSDVSRIGMVFSDPGSLAAARNKEPVEQIYKRDMNNPVSPFHGESIMDIMVPYYDGEKHIGAINIGLSLGQIEKVKEKYHKLILIEAIILIVFFMVIGKRLFKIIIQPLEKIAEVTREFKDNNSNIKLGIKSNDEIGILANEFEAMAERILLLLQALINSENNLKKQVDYLHTLIKNMNEFFFTYNSNGYLTFINRKFCELSTYSREEVIDKNVLDFVPELYKEKARLKMDNTLVNGVYESYEIVVLYRDGQEHFIQVNSAPIIENGVINGGMVVGEDISNRRLVEQHLKNARDQLEKRVKERTAELEKINQVLSSQIMQRKEIEEALAAEKERLTATLRSIGEGVITTDVEGKINMVNGVAEKIVDRKQSELLGKEVQEIFKMIDHDSIQNNYYHYDNYKDEGVKVFYNVVMNIDNEKRIIEANQTMISDPDNNFAGQVWAIRDITEKHKIEKELVKASKLESLGVLAGGLAHDFNNLLTVIVGNVTFAKSMLDDREEIKELLSEVEKASFQSKSLTHQLLTFARGGAPIRQAVSINKIVEDSAVFAMSGSNIKSEFCLQDDLWIVEVDKGQISQVINNLIINAIQAMPDGGYISICTKNISINDEIPALDAGEYVCVSIRDQGVGISLENQNKIFDPYFTTKETGSGLGLAISYSIIKKHQGHIRIDSKLGKGATFYIYLPALKKEIPADIIKNKDIVPDYGIGRILFMDDEEGIREVVGSMLESLGYDNCLVRDGEEAVKLYRQGIEENRPFKIVIMDLTIPGAMGGQETMQKLLEIDPEIKAIVSSGYANNPVMSEYQKWGFKGVITKPYGILELSQVIKEVINDNK